MGNEISYGTVLTLGHYRQYQFPEMTILLDLIGQSINATKLSEEYASRSCQEWMHSRRFAKVLDQAVDQTGIPFSQLIREVIVPKGQPSEIDHYHYDLGSGDRNRIYQTVIVTEEIAIDGIYLHPFLVYSFASYLDLDLPKTIDAMIAEYCSGPDKMQELIDWWRKSKVHHGLLELQERSSSPSALLLAQNPLELVEIEPLAEWRLGAQALLDRQIRSPDAQSYLILVIADVLLDSALLEEAIQFCLEHQITVFQHRRSSC